MYTIGKKANDVLKKTFTISNHNVDIFDHLEFDDVAEIAEDIMNSFVEGDYDKVMLVYNSFRNAATQIVTKEQFLPIKPIENVEEVNNTSEYISYFL